MNNLTTLKEKYRNMSAPVKASIWFTVCGIVQRGISLLTTPIFTRVLTTEQYGVFSIYNSWYDIISIFATLNLFYGAYNNAITKYPGDRNRITSSMQGLTTALTVVLFIVYSVARNFWNQVFGLSSLYIYAMFAELLFVPAYNFWSASERYDYKYRKLIFTTVLIALGSPILGLIAVLNTSYKAEARILSYVFIQVCIGLIFYILNFVRGKTLFDKKYWKYAMVLNVPLIPHYLSASVLNQSDRIMINSMIGTGQAAIYSVAYSVASMMTIITTAIKNTYTPFMYKSLKSKKYESIRTSSNMLVVFVGGMTLIAILLGPEIIAIFASKEYYDAIWVIPPVACAIFFKFLYPMFSTVEFYYEKTGFILLASCISAAVNIALNYVFIAIFGYYAAGYTTLICYILYSYGHYFFQKKILQKQEIGENSVFDIKFITISSGLLISVMVGITFLYHYYIPRYLICFCIVAIFIMKRDTIINMIKLIKK